MAGFGFVGQIPKAHAAPSCGDVLSIFARGSQNQREQNFNSQESASFYSSLESQLSNSNFQQVDLGNLDGDYHLEAGEYPATGSADWGVMSGMDEYYQSVAIGVVELNTFLTQRVLQCPFEAIVLAGYSQGAEVVSYAMSGRGEGDFVLQHIAYVALFGDPRNNPCDQLFNPYPWARGDSVCGAGILTPRDPYIPDALVGRTGSWCGQWDGICNGNLSHLPAWPGDPLSAHGSYAQIWIPEAAVEIAAAVNSKLYELQQASVPSA